MPRFTITVPGEINEWLTVAAGDDGPYDSKSEAARDYLALAHRVDQLDEDFENILDRAERVDELKRKAERLENEKQTLIHNHEEHTELVEFAEEQRELTRYQERRQRLLDQSNILTRWKWKLTGVPVATDHAESS